MNTSAILLLLLLFAAYSYFMARQKINVAYKQGKLKSEVLTLPKYFGYVAALSTLLPALMILLVLQMVDEPYLNSELSAFIVNNNIQGAENLDLYLNEIKGADTADKYAALSDDKKRVYHRYHEIETFVNRTTSVIVLSLSILMIIWGMRKIDIRTPARKVFEKIIETILLLAASIAIMTTVGIVFSVLFESVRFFGEVPITHFMFGTDWSPQTAIRTDQVGSSAAFGAVPLFVGTMLISLIALVVAVPLGLMSAIYLSEYASGTVRAGVKPVLEILAGIPTVVYGFFAALTVAPFIRDVGTSLGLSVASESALAAGLVMGIMIIPFVSSLSDDVISAVPQSLREGSLGLGATRSETITKVLIPAALPGIVGGVLLAASRAIGETMIVVMAAGLAANLTVNPLEAVTTVTVQIVTLLTGDQEFDSAKTLAAFALGLMLFVTTLILNVIALHVVRKYREHYE